MTRPRQDCPPHVLVLLLVALALVLWIGWRALTIEDFEARHGVAWQVEAWPGAARNPSEGSNR